MPATNDRWWELDRSHNPSRPNSEGLPEKPRAVRPTPIAPSHAARLPVDRYVNQRRRGWWPTEGR